MAKKKEPKPISPEMTQMENEKLFEFLHSQNFGSIEELYQFMEKNVLSNTIDEIIPPKKEKKTNIEKANDMMYEAYDSDPQTGLDLASKALKLDPNNARAMIYIADRMDDLEEEVKLYKKAMDLDQKALGEEFFKKHKGHLWLVHEARPYMTARMRYALGLYEMERIDESISELEALLELNPYDNQGIRYNLSAILMTEKKYDSYYKLYKKYNDDASAMWLYNYALFIFATEGPTQKANKALKKAYKSNKHILKFMIGVKKFKPNYYSNYILGTKSEASNYIMDNVNAWVKCNGSIKWIAEFYYNLKYG